jgi:tryptophan 2,3-dioxygenase
MLRRPGTSPADCGKAGSLATARRIAKILKTVVGQFDILETMTPRQFSSFRPELGGSSGFQSSQFRYIEAVLGRRDFSMVSDPRPYRRGATAPGLS